MHLVSQILAGIKSKKMLHFMMLLGLVGTLAVNPTPLVDEVEEGKKVSELLHRAYTESNITYSTLEEILEEIEAKKEKTTNSDDNVLEPHHNINKRALGCANTGVAYGSTTGTAFADFTSTNPWPCGVDITEIRIRSGSIIDAIQVTYKTVDGSIILKPQRGGEGGREQVIRLEDGERITGATGTTCTVRDRIDVVQLVFLSEKEDGQKVAYGPYGNSAQTLQNCRLFAVNGKINSIFGKVANNHLGAIGFYFEDESRGRQGT